MEEKKKKLSKTKRVILSLFIKLAIIASVILIFFFFIGDIGFVQSNDNFPNLKDGDLVITWKLEKYYAGDLVKYEYSGESHFGRIVALPGDIINITNEIYTVNGLIPYETIYFKTEPMDSNVVYPYEVKDGEVFILADYREQGLDSRTIGAIPISQLKGKSVFIFRSREF